MPISRIQSATAGSAGGGCRSGENGPEPSPITHVMRVAVSGLVFLAGADPLVMYFQQAQARARTDHPSNSPHSSSCTSSSFTFTSPGFTLPPWRKSHQDQRHLHLHRYRYRLHPRPLSRLRSGRRKMTILQPRSSLMCNIFST